MSEIFIPIKYKTNPLRLIFYAVFFSLMLFLLLPLSRMFQDYTKEEALVRTLELVTTPPPPPRQQEQEETDVIDDVITIERVKAEIVVEPLELRLEPSLEGDLKVQIEMGSFNVKLGKTALIAEMKMFSLSELDNTPTSLNDPLYLFSEDAVMQGVDVIRVEAFVLLTEKGEIEFESFISLSHQTAQQSVRQYIRKLRYTPPTKDGEVGRVRFRLPITLRRQGGPSARERANQRNRQNNSAKQPNN